MRVNVASQPMYTIIVDSGRRGLQAQGLTQSGALDPEAATWANWLCGNPINTPLLECMGPLTLTVDNQCQVAVCGPATRVQVNGQPSECWQTINVNAHQQLTLEPHQLGQRAYLAIRGQWQLTPTVYGNSTVKREKLGGLNNDGTALKVNDSWQIDTQVTGGDTHSSVGASSNNGKTHSCINAPLRRQVPTFLRPSYCLQTPLQVVTGYQLNHFARHKQVLFFNSEYTVSPQVDRMGYRLQGPNIAAQQYNMRSEGINLGAIQVPPDGQPIIMMCDRQTLGGYPKLGCVAPYDISRLAQAVPGDALHFSLADGQTVRTKMLFLQTRKHTYISGN